MNKLKYFEIKPYETVSQLLKRIKFDIGNLNYVILSCSDTMGKGVQILHLISTTEKTDQIKIEVLEEQMQELKDAFNNNFFNKPKKSKPTIKRKTIEGMTDLY